MIALLVAETTDAVEGLERTLCPLGFNLVHYRSPVKALDNLCELEPEAVFIDATDFPRHWKTLVQYIRADTTREQTVLVLLTGERFDQTDADKAAKLGVQGFVSSCANTAEDETRLNGLFSRYTPVYPAEGRLISPETAARVQFMCSNPSNGTIITGKLEALNLTSVRFRPDTSSAVAGMEIGMQVDNCSLKIDATLFDIVCRVTRNNYILSLDFVRPDPQMLNAIKQLPGIEQESTKAG